MKNSWYQLQGKGVVFSKSGRIWDGWKMTKQFIFQSRCAVEENDLKFSPEVQNMVVEEQRNEVNLKTCVLEEFMQTKAACDETPRNRSSSEFGYPWASTGQPSLLWYGSNKDSKQHHGRWWFESGIDLMQTCLLGGISCSNQGKSQLCIKLVHRYLIGGHSSCNFWISSLTIRSTWRVVGYNVALASCPTAKHHLMYSFWTTSTWSNFLWKKIPPNRTPSYNFVSTNNSFIPTNNSFIPTNDDK